MTGRGRRRLAARAGRSLDWSHCLQRLVASTVDWAAPAAGERWLDLGCGGGALPRALWERSAGRVALISVTVVAAPISVSSSRCSCRT